MAQGARAIALAAVLAAGLSVLTAGCGTQSGLDPVGDTGLAPGHVPDAYAGWVDQAGQLCAGITPPLLAAQLQTESGWNPTAVSPAGAQGIAQFMPGTWPAWGQDDDHNGHASPFDPGDAIMAEGRYMCALLGATQTLVDQGQAQGGPVDLALAAYNAGLGAVQAAHGIPPIPETQQYVTTIRQLELTYAAAPSGAAGGIPAIVSAAAAEVGQPYVWGGGGAAGPSGAAANGQPGFDCSGLVQYAVYQATGVLLPRLAADQATQGTPVTPSLSDMQPGDLIAFDLAGHGIDHIGIYAGNGQMIDAPDTGSNVRYDDLTSGYWAQQTWTVRRLG